MRLTAVRKWHESSVSWPPAWRRLWNSAPQRRQQKMSKSLKAQLAQKAEENTQRHREANYRDDFDVGRQHTKLPLDRIDPNPYQPRTSFPEEEIRELAVSISAVGLLQPISVRAVG